MKDPKKKLGKVDPYQYDSSQFKAQLRQNLMREYRAQHGVQHGVEEWAEAQPVKRGFGFKFAMAPVMAILVLTVFIGYEYFAQPMTAYAYMQKVQERYKGLEKGAKVRTTHVVGDTTYEIESRSDRHGNVHVRVVQEGLEVEDFVMKDGVLYTKGSQDEAIEESIAVPEVAAMMAEESAVPGHEVVDEVLAAELEEKRLAEEAVRRAEKQAERLEDLTSIINSMVLAEVANPQDEWNEIMEREDTEFVEQSDGTVLITYEDTLDGEVFVNEYYFRDFVPVRKLRKAKHVNRPHEVVKTRSSVLANTVQVVKYEEVAPTNEVINSTQHKVFVENDEFNQKLAVFVKEEVDDLVEEFEELPEKDVYFAVWQDEKAESVKRGLSDKSTVIAEIEKEVADIEVLADVMEDVEEIEDADVAAVMEDDEDVEDQPEEMLLKERVEEPLLPLVDRESPLPDQPLIEPMDEFIEPVVRELPDRESVDVSETLVAPAPSVHKPEKPFIRDVYLEEVFIDLLEDKPKGEVIKEEKPKESELVEKETPSDVVEDSDTGEVDSDSDVKETEEVIPKENPDHKEEPVVESHELIDTSQPEPYMAEPIDPIVVPIVEPDLVPHADPVPVHSDGASAADATVRIRNNTQLLDRPEVDVHITPLTEEERLERERLELEKKGDGAIELDSPSYVELIQFREDWQRNAAEERFRDRMEDQLKKLDPQTYDKEIAKPESNFRR